MPFSMFPSSLKANAVQQNIESDQYLHQIVLLEHLEETYGKENRHINGTLKYYPLP